jgi:peptidoglycan/LPS O-acetylase OafA/YrhL
MSSNAPALNSIEGLRLIASLLIVAGHYIPYVQMIGMIARFHLAVDLFFAISGIVIAYKYQGRITNMQSYNNFMSRRLARLYPLHLITMLFYVAIGLLALMGSLKVDDKLKYNFDILIQNLLLVHAWFPNGVISFNYVSWSISAEFFVYLLFPLISLALAHHLLRCICLIAALTLLAMMMSQVIMDDSFTRLTWNGGILRAIPSFAFGVFVCQHRERLTAMLGKLNLSVAVHIICVITVGLMLGRAPDYLILPFIWSLVACGFFCDMSGKSTLLAHRILSEFGYLTYSIYMLHTVVATVFIAVLFPKLLGTSFNADLISVILSTIILLALSWCSYHYFEQPLRQWLNKQGQPMPKPQ